MKKVFSIFTLALLMLAMGSCSDNESSDKRTINAQVLNNSVRIADATSEKVSLSPIAIELNITNSTISLNYSVPVSAGNTVTINFKDAQLNPNNELNCYTFTSENPGNNIVNFKGYYSPSIGCLHIEFDAFGTHHVSTNADLYFPYSNITLINTEFADPTPKENKNAQSIISINPDGMTAALAMGDFALDNNTGIINSVVFTGLKATATADGFKVVATQPVKSQDNIYTLNAFEANVTANGRVINATFTLDTKYTGTITGTQFAK